MVARGVLIATLAGCGYTSQYTPPADGRARPLWVEDHVISSFDRLRLSPGCNDALYWTAHPEHPVAVAAPTEFWVPVPHRAVVPAPIIDPAARRDDDEPPIGDPRSFLLPLLPVFWPVAALVLAASRPEAHQFSAEAIDEVNAYNDLSRRAGTPCSYGAP
jgi:hypothetical protein